MRKKIIGIFAWLVQKFLDFFVVVFMPASAVVCVLWLMDVI